MRYRRPPGGWQLTTLGAIADRGGFGLVDGPFGSNLPASEYVQAGVPVIRGSNLSLGKARFRDGGYVFVSSQTAARLARSLCRAGDIIFTKKGTLGQTGVVPLASPYEVFLLSSNQMKLTVDPAYADPLFVYYYVSSAAVRDKIVRDSEATGVPKTNLAYLRTFPILLPRLQEQQAIAHILSALDDKIELNRRMNETLEAIARAIFKSWFVDFDPVRAKSEGRRPDGIDDETAKLFPNRFEDSPQGKIPLGWRTGKIGDVATLSRQSLNPSRLPDEVFDHYSIPAFDDGRVPASDVGAQIRSNKFLVPENAVLLSKLNPRFPRVWLPSLTTPRRALCSTEFLMLLPRRGFARSFLYSLVASVKFRDTFISLVTGTSSSHQRVKPEDLLEMDTVIPPNHVASGFAKIAAPTLESVARNLQQSRTLAAIRDELLPKLLSGEVRVGSAGRVVSEVV